MRNPLIEALFISVLATTPGATAVAQPAAEPTAPIFTVELVTRTITAVNYPVDGRHTAIDFRGTALAPRAHGKAKVETEEGGLEIDAEFDDLPVARSFGGNSLTYVLWAITPDGRPENLGEVRLDGDDAKLEVRTPLQSFGMIVTAEPHFAVTRPSHKVVLENEITGETVGRIRPVLAKYELLERDGDSTIEAPVDLGDPTAPLDLLQARAAIREARLAGAESHAAETLQQAEVLLAQAERQRAGRSQQALAMSGREAVQTAHDARLIAERRQEELRRQAERRRANDEQQRANEEQQRADNERQRANEEQQRRLEAERERAALALERSRLEADKSRLEQDKAALRAELVRQLSTILVTRETARGLIVNVPDVLFQVDQATLTAPARETLAKVSGILLAYPGLFVEVEGHTDSTGSDDYNQALSERRADSVRDYLVTQSLPADAIVARGFGETTPIADNSTDPGRQRNRRVELIISGEILGVQLSQVHDQSPLGRPR